MSLESVREVMNKAAHQIEFRNYLVENPFEALKEYDLTEDEIKTLADVAASFLSWKVDKNGNRLYWIQD